MLSLLIRLFPLIELTLLYYPNNLFFFLISCYSVIYAILKCFNVSVIAFSFSGGHCGTRASSDFG